MLRLIAPQSQLCSWRVQRENVITLFLNVFDWNKSRFHAGSSELCWCFECSNLGFADQRMDIHIFIYRLHGEFLATSTSNRGAEIELVCLPLFCSCGTYRVAR